MRNEILNIQRVQRLPGLNGRVDCLSTCKYNQYFQLELEPPENQLR